MSYIKRKSRALLQTAPKYAQTDIAYATRGAFWLITGKGGLALISVALLTAFANWVPQETYGAYQYVLSVVAIFALASLPGINTALIKSIAQNKEGALQAAVRTKLRWGLLGSLGLLAVAGWYFLNQNYILALSFFITAIILPAKQSFNIFSFFWIGRKSFDIRAKYMFLSALFSTLVLIATIYVTANLALIILAFFASYTFFDFLFFKKTLRRVKNNAVDPSAISFGKTLTLINGVEMIAIYIDKVVLWQLAGPVQVAIYSFAQLPIQKIQEAIPIPFLALPKLGEQKTEGGRKKEVLIKFIWLFALAIPAAIILALVAPLAYRLLFPQYLGSVIYFQVLTVLIALSPFALLHAVLIAEAKKRALYIAQTTAPVIRIILFLILAPLWGIWGVVWAILGTEALRGLMTLYYFQKL